MKSGISEQVLADGHFGQNYYQKTMIFFEGTQTDYIEFSPSHKEKKEDKEFQSHRKWIPN